MQFFHVEGESVEQELGEKIVVVATGGYSELLADYIKRKFDYIVPELTLIGLKYIFYSNKANFAENIKI